MFITQIFEPQLFSSHAMCLHTRLTVFFLNCRCLLCLCLLYRMVISIMNSLKGEFICLREFSINVYKLLGVFLLPVLFIRYLILYCTLLLLVYFCAPFFFLLMLLLYFCLFINHINKPIIFSF